MAPPVSSCRLLATSQQSDRAGSPKRVVLTTQTFLKGWMRHQLQVAASREFCCVCCVCAYALQTPMEKEQATATKYFGVQRGLCPPVQATRRFEAPSFLPSKRGPGRPKGSRNKKPKIAKVWEVKSAPEAAEPIVVVTMKVVGIGEATNVKVEMFVVGDRRLECLLWVDPSTQRVHDVFTGPEMAWPSIERSSPA